MEEITMKKNVLILTLLIGFVFPNLSITFLDKNSFRTDS